MTCGCRRHPVDRTVPAHFFDVGKNVVGPATGLAAVGRPFGHAQPEWAPAAGDEIAGF